MNVFSCTRVSEKNTWVSYEQIHVYMPGLNSVNQNLDDITGLLSAEILSDLGKMLCFNWNKKKIIKQNNRSHFQSILSCISTHSQSISFFLLPISPHCQCELVWPTKDFCKTNCKFTYLMKCAVKVLVKRTSLIYYAYNNGL